MEKNERNEMNKVNKRNFFVRITRKKAKQAIIERQRKLGRKLTWDEKVVIINKKAEEAKIRTGAWALAGAIGLTGGIVSYKMLTDREKQNDEIGIEETYSETQDGPGTTAEEIFREELKVPEENKIVIPSTVSDIYHLDTKDEVLNWWKDLYIDEYEKMTGNETLTTADIKIVKSDNGYAYELDNGQIVTHGSYVEGVKNAIEADGHKYTRISMGDVYTVRIKETDEVIDCMTEDFKQAIHGDSYSKMKDEYNSVLAEMGKVTEITYKLMDAIKYDYKVDDVQSELASALKEYYKKQENKVNDEKVILENETNEIDNDER